VYGLPFDAGCGKKTLSISVLKVLVHLRVAACFGSIKVCITHVKSPLLTLTVRHVFGCHSWRGASWRGPRGRFDDRSQAGNDRAVRHLLAR